MKNRNAFICILPYFNFGGASTLYYRMLKWADKNDYKAVLFIKKEIDFEEKWIGELKKSHIEYLFYKEKSGKYYYWDSNDEPVSCFQNYTHVKCIVSDMFEYFTANDIENKINSRDFQTLFYVIHPFELSYTKFYSINRLYYHLFLKRIYAAGQLIFMDNQSRDTYIRKYGGQKEDTKIVRLGMEIKDLNQAVIEQKRNNEYFQILSISRMEFPFKGYVLGLLDDFVKLNQMGLKVKLTLVGDGHDMPVLKSKISEFGKEIQAHIQLVGNVSYSALEQYLKIAHVLIGMGTTLLDGAGAGVPGVIATSYQTSNYSCGQFYQMPHVIGYVYGDEGSTKSRLIDEILFIYHLSPDEYVNLCEETYKVYRNYYDIDHTMKELLDVEGESIQYQCPEKIFFKTVRFLVSIKDWFRRKLCT